MVKSAGGGVPGPLDLNHGAVRSASIFAGSPGLAASVGGFPSGRVRALSESIRPWMGRTTWRRPLADERIPPGVLGSVADAPAGGGGGGGGGAGGRLCRTGGPARRRGGWRGRGRSGGGRLRRLGRHGSQRDGGRRHDVRPLDLGVVVAGAH